MWRQLDDFDHEMLELVRLGLSNAQVAKTLARSPHTIRNRLSRLYERFGVATRAELVALLGAPPDDRYDRTGSPSPPKR